jgi:peptidoglycan/xylan/chitin deacetylase (PgdA/CDA1 family)
MYHEISADPKMSRRLSVTPADFASQLDYLRDEGFTTLRAADLAAALEPGGPELPAKPVVLTFDDGFADFSRQALPALSQRGFNATLYITTGWITDADPRHRACAEHAGDAPPGTISWTQVKQARAAGVEIGAHSVGHHQLDQLTIGPLRCELAASKSMLEDQLGAAVTGLSYPFGYSSRRVRRIAAEIGYDYACAVGNQLAGRGDDRLALPRVTISRATGAGEFARIVGARRLPAAFWRYRALTKGYAVVRRLRAVGNELAPSQDHR